MEQKNKKAPDGTPIANRHEQDLVIYKTPDGDISINVIVENDTVWLTQQQMGQLFGKDRRTVNEHIGNIFKEGELEEEVVCRKFRHTTQHGSIKGKTQESSVKIYNLDVIISVGYRVKSQRGTQFRIWATKTLRDYILKGYAISQRFERLEYRVTENEKKIDFFVKTALPPVEGVFYDGQIFDAYRFVSELIKSAKKSIVLIDNYLDDSILTLLSKRNNNVTAKIYSANITNTFQLDLRRHNAQYEPVTVEITTKVHDRFLIIDNDVFHIGASLKDLGKRLFAFSKMTLKANELINNIK